MRDCVKRAITKATGMEYGEVALQLNRCKKVTKCEAFNLPKNFEYFLKNSLHLDRIAFPPTKGEPRMNGERFAETHPKGRYILRMARHLSCCIDGIIYDTWDCTEKCVYAAWKVS